jgi:hypothetical protein
MMNPIAQYKSAAITADGATAARVTAKAPNIDRRFVATSPYSVTPLPSRNGRLDRGVSLRHDPAALVAAATE